MDWITEHLPGITIWLAALGTLALYSVLYRENPAYRFVEHIFIGAAAGYGVYLTWTQVLQPLWWSRIIKGEWYWVLALVGGAMFYFIYSKKYVWISRIIFGALLGLVSGMAFKGFAGTVIDQISASFKPVASPGMHWTAALSNVFFMAILLAVMAYFFFSFEHRSTVRRVPANVGRWVLMFAFGAMFGATVMARMALLIGRFDFLLRDWMHIAK